LISTLHPIGRAPGIALLASLVLAGASHAEPDLDRFAQHALKDFTATNEIVQKNPAVLDTIGRNFAQGYRIRQSVIWYKEPSKLRVDAKAGFLSVRYVINGNRKSTQVPGLHINKARDITGRPGEAQGMLDSGLITPAFLTNSVASRYVGQRPLDGRSVPVFEFWYTADKLSRHHLLWVDPDKKIVLRHDVDDRHGHPWMRYMLKQPIQVSGIWVPTRLEVYAADGRLAATTRCSGVKINSGLGEGLFRM